MSAALLIVDVQNDFCPGGALPTPKGDKIVPVLNKLMDKFSIIIASRDWHPGSTNHFDKWPVHCVAGTKGAELHPDLDKTRINHYIKKDTEKDIYSGFQDTKLLLYLRENKVDKIFICGLATDVCVKATAIDAIKNDYLVYVFKDAIKGVNADTTKTAYEEMKKCGVIFVNSDEI